MANENLPTIFKRQVQDEIDKFRKSSLTKKGWLGKGKLHQLARAKVFYITSPSPEPHITDVNHCLESGSYEGAQSDTSSELAFKYHYVFKT